MGLTAAPPSGLRALLPVPSPEPCPGSHLSCSGSGTARSPEGLLEVSRGLGWAGADHPAFSQAAWLALRKDTGLGANPGLSLLPIQGGPEEKAEG